MRASIVSTVFVITAGFGLASTAGATVAARDEVPLRETVRYSNADLQTRSSADGFYLRLSRAAKNVCGGSSPEPFITMSRGYRECRDETLAAAVHQVDRPLLTQAYDSRLKSTALSALHRPAATRAPHA